MNKITSHFAGHLKNEECSIDESIKFIEKVFQLGGYQLVKKHSPLEEKHKIIFPDINNILWQTTGLYFTRKCIVIQSEFFYLHYIFFASVLLYQLE